MNDEINAMWERLHSWACCIPGDDGEQEYCAIVGKLVGMATGRHDEENAALMALVETLATANADRAVEIMKLIDVRHTQTLELLEAREEIRRLQAQAAVDHETIMTLMGRRIGVARGGDDGMERE